MTLCKLIKAFYKSYSQPSSIFFVLLWIILLNGYLEIHFVFLIELKYESYTSTPTIIAIQLNLYKTKWTTSKGGDRMKLNAESDCISDRSLKPFYSCLRVNARMMSARNAMICTLWVIDAVIIKEALNNLMSGNKRNIATNFIIFSKKLIHGDVGNILIFNMIGTIILGGGWYKMLIWDEAINPPSNDHTYF